jgi:hypothetical protein
MGAKVEAMADGHPEVLCCCGPLNNFVVDCNREDSVALSAAKENSDCFFIINFNFPFIKPV